MAVPTIKSTYPLDLETVRQLEHLAKFWGTSKSAALRRAVQLTAKQLDAVDPNGLDALDSLQCVLALDEQAAASWEKQARQERRASAKQVVARGRHDPSGYELLIRALVRGSSEDGQLRG